MRKKIPDPILSFRSRSLHGMSKSSPSKEKLLLCLVGTAWPTAGKCFWATGSLTMFMRGLHDSNSCSLSRISLLSLELGKSLFISRHCLPASPSTTVPARVILQPHNSESNIGWMIIETKIILFPSIFTVPNTTSTVQSTMCQLSSFHWSKSMPISTVFPTSTPSSTCPHICYTETMLVLNFSFGKTNRQHMQNHSYQLKN